MATQTIIWIVSFFYDQLIFIRTDQYLTFRMVPLSNNLHTSVDYALTK
jgi:hypothetical protein